MCVCVCVFCLFCLWERGGEDSTILDRDERRKRQQQQKRQRNQQENHGYKQRCAFFLSYLLALCV